MTSSEAIIEKFGGIREMARKMGVPVSTVQGWRNSGHIPAGRQQAVLDAAKAQRIRLKPADFFA